MSGLRPDRYAPGPTRTANPTLIHTLVPPPAVAPAPRWSENAGAVIG